MSIPAKFLSTKDPMNLVMGISSWAESIESPNKATRYLLMLSRFMGTWENGGDIFHNVDVWSNNLVEIVEMLNFFECSLTATAFKEAITINDRLIKANDDGLKIPQELAMKRDEIEEIALLDTDYDKLATFIRNNRSLFRSDLTGA